MTNAPTTRETADRETLVMQSIIDAHGQWEIENRNRKQGDGQLWQDGHVRLLAQAAIIAADHIGEANEKVTADHAELARLAEAADAPDPETWGKAGRKYWNNREKFSEAANPATVLALLSEIAALRGEVDVLEVEKIGLRSAIFGSHDYDPSLRHGNFIEMARQTEDARKGALSRATQAERQRDEAVGLLIGLQAIFRGNPARHALMSWWSRAKDRIEALANKGADQ